MRLFIFSRRAQIRGLDFSLAIIIFSLTITQVLILTDTFISGNRTVINLDQQSELTNTLAIELVESNGYYGAGISNWANVPTPALTSSTWNLGLSTSGQIDPFKLGRLSNWSLSDYALSYNNIQQGLNVSVPISIQVLNQIDLNITSVQNGVQDLIVKGSVTKLSKPLNQAQVWIYGLSSSGEVVQSYITTNTDGMFSTDLIYSGPVAGDYFSVVGFAKYGESSQDSDVYYYDTGLGAVPNTQISIFSSNNFAQGYVVNTTTDFGVGVDSGQMYAFYPGMATGVLNYTISTLSASTGNLWTNDTVQIPQSGMAVFVGLGYQGSTLQAISSIDFPIALNGHPSAIIKPSTTPQNTSSSVIIPMTVRDVILQLQLTIWEA